MLKLWIEAMRLRTLPVSIAGVLAGISCAIMNSNFSFVPAVLCLLFALLAQIASNFGNEYYDYVNGLDRKGREGFRRGVTEGDISPKAMKWATYATLALAACIGCTMLFYGGWWLLPVGILIALFALAYSAGPYPLSHHGLGDVAVVIFFGIVPVTLTCYLQEGGWQGVSLSLPVSVAVGLLAANVLIVNNYRDMEDDKAVGKRTTVVIFGRETMGRCYLIAGFIAMAAMFPVWIHLSLFSFVVPLLFLLLHVKTWKKIKSSHGSALNPLLGATAKNLLLFTIMFFICSLIRFFA